MKSYKITVNGNVYDVTVEETGVSSSAAAAPQTVQAAPVSPAPAAPAAPKTAAGAGAIEITANVPGKIFKIETSVGTAVKSGDTVIVLEAMKMEIPVVAPQDGVIASIHVSVGDAVESGDLLATMNG